MFGFLNRCPLDMNTYSVFPASPLSTEAIVDTSRSNMRREATRIIADDPDHPLRFLLNNSGTGFKPADGTSHFDLINQPDVVQMGHVVSAKTGHTEYVVLQTAYENQILNNSIERSGIGGAVLGFPVIEIGGVAVSRETAELWELLEYLPAGTVANAPRVNIPAPPPGTCP